MTVVEMSALLGPAMYDVKGMVVDVEVIDVRTQFGRVDVKITPVNGQGFTWVESGTVYKFGRVLTRPDSS